MFATHVSNDLYLKLKHALTHALASYEGIKKTNSPIRERVVQALPPNGLSPGPVCVGGGGAGSRTHSERRKWKPQGESAVPAPDRLRAQRSDPESRRPHDSVWHQGVGLPDISQAADVSSDWSNHLGKLAVRTEAECPCVQRPRTSPRRSPPGRRLGGRPPEPRPRVFLAVLCVHPRLQTTIPRWQENRVSLHHGTLRSEDREPPPCSTAWVNLADVTLSRSHAALRPEAGDLNAQVQLGAGARGVAKGLRGGGRYSQPALGGICQGCPLGTNPSTVSSGSVRFNTNSVSMERDPPEKHTGGRRRWAPEARRGPGNAGGRHPPRTTPSLS